MVQVEMLGAVDCGGEDPMGSRAGGAQGSRWVLVASEGEADRDED